MTRSNMTLYFRFDVNKKCINKSICCKLLVAYLDLKLETLIRRCTVHCVSWLERPMNRKGGCILSIWRLSCWPLNAPVSQQSMMWLLRPRLLLLLTIWTFCDVAGICTVDGLFYAWHVALPLFAWTLLSFPRWNFYEIMQMMCAHKHIHTYTELVVGKQKAFSIKISVNEEEMEFTFCVLIFF